MPDAAPAREAPAPEPLHRWLDDPSHPAVPNEPVLDIDNIQGNILGGFMKDHQLMLCLRITDGPGFKAWLKSQVPFIASSAEVLAFNRLFKALRRRRGKSDAIKATWVNIAFSYRALWDLTDRTDLALTDGNDFADEAFKAGLVARSPDLGDPTGDSEGSPKNWMVGGEGNEVDVVLIIASDERADMLTEVQRILQSLYDAGDPTTLLFPVEKQLDQMEAGENLPEDRAGHEHFGFLDGVSQPGLRGRLSNDPRDVLTPRQNPNDRDQGKPGQDLLWPGEFVFGYPTQKSNADDEDVQVTDPGPLSMAGPAWAVNGSFLVFRRLKQNVHAFHQFLNSKSGEYGLTPDGLGARLVGRWPSGAPVVRVPGGDNPDLGRDDCANNHFEFQDASDPISRAGVLNTFDCVDIQFPQSPGDPGGLLCPWAGHIRKIYPRDDRSESKKDDVPDDCHARQHLDEVDTQTHRLLRRGIPFGKASDSTPDNPRDDGDPRGLYFLAYQTSIVEQFEFVTRCWANNPNFKEPETGYDPIIGQNGGRADRKRWCAIVVGGEQKTIDLPTEWVVPTGGGYFFAPSIRALEQLAEANP